MWACAEASQRSPPQEGPSGLASLWAPGLLCPQPLASTPTVHPPTCQELASSHSQSPPGLSQIRVRRTPTSLLILRPVLLLIPVCAAVLGLQGRSPQARELVKEGVPVQILPAPAKTGLAAHGAQLRVTGHARCPFRSAHRAQVRTLSPWNNVEKRVSVQMRQFGQSGVQGREQSWAAKAHSFLQVPQLQVCSNLLGGLDLMIISTQ